MKPETRLPEIYKENGYGVVSDAGATKPASFAAGASAAVRPLEGYFYWNNFCLLEGAAQAAV